ncbi:MAG: methylated-DNA--[Clostridia bacterium]|nr:methylated-DNA--[protein]-cysteine S-methyltransferase [Clostridia bacterium]
MTGEKRFCYIETPIGTLYIEEDGRGITRVDFVSTAGEDNSYGSEFLGSAAKQLGEYFAGERKAFSLPLSLSGTVFQQKVWNELLKIPYGQTRSYGEIAAAAGNPKACRAVGMAVHRNPVAVIVPCHRVIGKNGSLTGYAAGLDKKIKLLTLESTYSQNGSGAALCDDF